MINATVKVVDPDTSEVDREYTGYVRVYVDGEPVADVYIEGGEVVIQVPVGDVSEHTISAAILSGAGGWGKVGSVGGGPTEDVPEYLIGPTGPSGGTTINASRRPTAIQIESFSYEWLDENNVNITVSGKVIDSVSKKCMTSGTVKISVMKGGWREVVSVQVGSDGSFSWSGVVDPERTYLKLEYTPPSDTYEPAVIQLPLFEAGATNLGGEASTNPLYYAVAVAVIVVAVAIYVLRRR